MFHPRYMFHALAGPVLVDSQEALDALPDGEWADSPDAAQQLAQEKAGRALVADDKDLIADETLLAEGAVAAAELAARAEEIARDAALQAGLTPEKILAEDEARKAAMVDLLAQGHEKLAENVTAALEAAGLPVAEDVALTPQEVANAEMEATIARLIADGAK